MYGQWDSLYTFFLFCLCLFHSSYSYLDENTIYGVMCLRTYSYRLLHLSSADWLKKNKQTNKQKKNTK